MSSWNSVPLHVSSEALGWFAFGCWSISFYPQIILNYQTKSVVGFNFDYALLNTVKQASYLVYNMSLFFSASVQKQYRNKYGQTQMIPVAANDVAFSGHAFLLCLFTLYQITIYERGNQKVSKIALGVSIGVGLASAIFFFIALPHHDWLWLVSMFNNIQVLLTIAKYVPQAWMNYMRKSTTGWSIGCVLLDFFGGLGNLMQMIIQSIDRGSLKNLFGNMGKLALALVSIIFDLLFIFQHYCLYRSKDVKVESTIEADNIKSSDQPLPLPLPLPLPENV